MIASYLLIRNQFSHLAISCFVLTLVLLVRTEVNAQSTVWSNANSGFWHESTNWTSGVPQPSDNIFFNLDESYFAFWNGDTGHQQAQTAHFSQGSVALFNTDQTQNYNLLLRGNTGLPGLTVSGIANISGVDITNLGDGFVNTNGHLNLFGREGRTHHYNEGLFRHDGTTDVSGLVRVINESDIGIGFGSFGGATTASLSIGDDSEMFTKRNVYMGRDFIGLSTKTGILNISSEGMFRVGESESFLRPGLLVDDISPGDGGGNLLADNGSTINVQRTEIGRTGRGLIELKNASMLNTESLLMLGDQGFQNANGELRIRSGSKLITNTASIGGISGQAHVLVSGEGSLLWSKGILHVGNSGLPGTITIADGGVVKSAIPRINLGGSVVMQGGRFEFRDLHSLPSLARITGQAGSLAGTVIVSETDLLDINSFGALNNHALDSSEVLIDNSGLISGNGFLQGQVINQAGGELRAEVGDTLRFQMGTTNIGTIRNLGGRVHLDREFINHSLVTGNGLFITDQTDNRGTMRFQDGSTLFLGEVDNRTTVTTRGDSTTAFRDNVVTHQNSQFETVIGSTTVFQNSYRGTGIFTGGGTVVFEDSVAPGASPASIEFAGDVVFESGSLLEIELGGLLDGEFDQLLVAGDLTLGGDLFVSLIDQWQLEMDQEFLISDVGGMLNGQFNGLDEGGLVGNFAGQDLFISYQAGNGNDIALYTVSAVPEPASCLALLTMAMMGCFRRQRKV